jgi:hypothetical protein
MPEKVRNSTLPDCKSDSNKIDESHLHGGGVLLGEEVPAPRHDDRVNRTQRNGLLLLLGLGVNDCKRPRLAKLDNGIAERNSNPAAIAIAIATATATATAGHQPATAPAALNPGTFQRRNQEVNSSRMRGKKRGSAAGERSNVFHLRGRRYLARLLACSPARLSACPPGDMPACHG